MKHEEPTLSLCFSFIVLLCLCVKVWGSLTQIYLIPNLHLSLFHLFCDCHLHLWIICMSKCNQTREHLGQMLHISRELLCGPCQTGSHCPGTEPNKVTQPGCNLAGESVPTHRERCRPPQNTSLQGKQNWFLLQLSTERGFLFLPGKLSLITRKWMSVIFLNHRRVYFMLSSHLQSISRQENLSQCLSLLYLKNSS